MAGVYEDSKYLAFLESCVSSDKLMVNYLIAFVFQHIQFNSVGRECGRGIFQHPDTCNRDAKPTFSKYSTAILG